MAFETTNVAEDVKPPGFDAVKTLGGFADLQNSLNQNKFFQAKNLGGQYLEQSTGPDGQPDFNKLSQYLANDPRTGPYAADLIAAAKGIQSTGVTTQANRLGIAGVQYNHARDIAANAKTAALQHNGQLKPGETAIDPDKAAISAVTQGVAAGLYSPDTVASLLGSGDFKGNNINASMLSGAGGAAPTEALLGTAGTVDNGQQNQAVNVNRVTNTRTPMSGDAANVKLQNSPAVMSTPINVVDPSTGQKTQHILSDFLNPDNTWKEGKTPPLVDAGPLNNTARAALGSAYGPQIANFEAEVAAAPQTKTLIQQMRTAVGQFDTGPHSDFWRNMGELAHEYHIDFDPNNLTKTSAAEVFNKIVPSLLRQQASMLGMNETDTGRQIAATSIPTNGLTDKGILKVLSTVEGNTDAINAQGKVWQQEKEKNGPGSYGNFRMEFSRKMPPSVFQSQYMSPTEIKEMQKGWSPSQVSDWTKRRDIAKAQGWLPNAQ